MLSNDTVNAGAHVLLPAAAWGEKDGTVTNSERRISRQRAFLPLPGEAKPDWWIVSRGGAAHGLWRGASPIASAADIFREHAALSAFENDGARDFDHRRRSPTIDDDAFDALEPVQWPVRDERRRNARRASSPTAASSRPTARRASSRRSSPRCARRSSDAFPLRLNTGRVRDQWHTMTRTGKSPRLGAHLPEPFVEVHPADADDARA